MNNLSVKQKITIATALVVLISVTFFSYINYSRAKQQIVQQAETDIVNIGENLTTFVSNWISSKQTILAAASQFSTDRANHARILEQGQKSGDFLYMYIGSDQGEMIMFPKEDLPADYDPRTRPWYKQAKQQNRAILTAPYVDASSGELIVSFARPTGLGVIAADVKMNVVATEILSVALGESGQAFLIDSANAILIHENQDYFEQKLNELVSEGQIDNSVSTIVFEGTEKLAASFPIANTPWSIVVSVDKDEALGELTNLTIQNFISTIVTIAVVTLVVGLLINVLLNPLKNLADAMEDIAKGDADLTQRLAVNSNDEIGTLSQYFNNFVESIHTMVTDVIASANQLENISNQTKSVAGENNQAIQSQQSEITQVAAAIHEMSATSATVAENARVTAESATSVQSETEHSEVNALDNQKRMQTLTSQIDETTVVINKLNEQAMQINTILATIQGIAEQTNLLALNAAIEAARAGDQGRGFAVVADEVRALSQRTHEATGEIQSMIEALSNQTSSAVTQMTKSKSLVEDTMQTAEAVSSSQAGIKAAIQDINRQAITIAEASREQNAATDEINRISQAIQDESQRLSENVQSAYQMSEQLNELGANVQSHLRRFKI